MLSCVCSYSRQGVWVFRQLCRVDSTTGLLERKCFQSQGHWTQSVISYSPDGWHFILCRKLLETWTFHRWGYCSHLL